MTLLPYWGAIGFTLTMRGLRWSAVTTGLCASLIAVILGQVTAQTVQAAVIGNSYVPLSPVRLLDTRTNGETLGATASLNLQVAGIGEVPAGATAVAVNVTATDATAPSFLSVYPTGESQPSSSNLNWSTGDTVANLAIVPVGTGGDLTFYNQNGNVDLVIDLQGYFVASGGSGGDYLPLAPQRITDTRAGSGYPNAGSTLGADSTLNIQVGGVGGVPAEGVSAVVLNVTATDTTAYSLLAVYPEGESNPGTSSENWATGVTVANRVVVPLSASGQISVHNDLGSADVVVDVSGYFAAGTSSAAAASLYYPIPPTRMLDTRVDANRLDASSHLGEQFAGVDGISSQATAIVANLTSTDASSASYYTLAPQEAPPTTSDLNWLPGVTVANLGIATLNSAGDAFLFNADGSADAVIDVFGYFVPVSGTNMPAIQPCSSATLNSTGSTVSGSPVDVTSQAVCPAGESVQYTYWYLAPGSSVWSLEGAPSANASFQYNTAGWGDGAYQLMAWASSQTGIYQGVLNTSTIIVSANPSTNLPDTFLSTCYWSGYASLTCGQAEIAAIDSARSGEGLGPLAWPAALSGLSEAEQEFVVADQERVSRGLPAIAGLTAAANQSATDGAQSNTDPDGLNVPGAIAYGSNLADGYGSLGAMFDWMYNDGPGSFNIDCPTSSSPGCWVHRDDILLNTGTGVMAAPSGYTWVGGTACVPESGLSYLNSCTLEWVLVPISSVSYVFTWTAAVALGA